MVRNSLIVTISLSAFPNYPTLGDEFSSYIKQYQTVLQNVRPHLHSLLPTLCRIEIKIKEWQCFVF